MSKLIRKISILSLVILALTLAGCSIPDRNRATKKRRGIRVKLADQKSIKSLLSRADEQLKNSDYTRAVDTYEKALKIDPSNIKALNGMAYALIKLKKYDEAKKHLMRVLAIDPSNYEGRALLARVYLEQGDREGFLKEHKNAYGLDSTSFKGNFEYGIALQTAGKHKESIQYLYRALKFKPGKKEKTDLHRMLGMAYRNVGNLEKSREHLIKSAERGSARKKIMAYIILMDHLTDADYFHRAMAVNKKIVGIESHRAIIDNLDDNMKGSYYKSLADALFTFGDYDDAIKYWSLALKYINDPRYYIPRAQCYFLTGRFKQAKDDISKWRAAGPPEAKNAEDHIDYALASFCEGNIDKAIELINRDSAKGEDLAALYGCRSVFNYWKGDIKGYRENYKKLREYGGKVLIEETDAALKSLKKVKMKSKSK